MDRGHLPGRAPARRLPLSPGGLRGSLNLLLSFVVPAHDESGSIAAVVAAIRAAAGERPHEIVVVDDASADGTGALAAAAGARVLRVERRHIAATRNAGARATTGEVLVFVDADTLIGPEVVAGLERVLAAGAVGGGAGVRFDDPVPRWVHVVLPLLLPLARLARFTGGCFLFCHRDAFDAVGGFDEALYAAEEIALCRALGRRGRFVVLRETVLTSGRKLRTYSGGELLRAMARVLFAGRGGLHDRSRLDIWYAPRRPDRSGPR